MEAPLAKMATDEIGFPEQALSMEGVFQNIAEYTNVSDLVSLAHTNLTQCIELSVDDSGTGSATQFQSSFVTEVSFKSRVCQAVVRNAVRYCAQTARLHVIPAMRLAAGRGVVMICFCVSAACPGLAANAAAVMTRLADIAKLASRRLIFPTLSVTNAKCPVAILALTTTKTFTIILAGSVPIALPSTPIAPYVPMFGTSTTRLVPSSMLR